MRHAWSVIVRIGALTVLGLAALMLWRSPRRHAHDRDARPPGPAPDFTDTQPLVHDSDDWYLMPSRTGTDR